MIKYIRKEKDPWGVNTYIYNCIDCGEEITYYRLITKEGHVPRCSSCKSKKQNAAFKKKLAAEHYTRAISDVITALGMGAIELPDKNYKELMQLLQRLIKLELNANYGRSVTRKEIKDNEN